MKVTSNSSANIFQNGRTGKAKAGPSGSENIRIKSDSIEISSAAPERTTAQLVESLKSQILGDVKAGIDSHKLEELKREISSGNYDVNPADIVYKIMGD